MSQLMMRRPGLDNLPDIQDLGDGRALRLATFSDCEPLAKLLSAAFPDMEWSVERVEKELLNDSNVPRTYIVEDDSGRALATASCQRIEAFEPDGFVHWVASDPQARGLGLGRLVSVAVLHGLQELGFQGARLTTDDERIPAIRTYLQLGFVPVLQDETHPSRWADLAAKLPDLAHLIQT